MNAKLVCGKINRHCDLGDLLDYYKNGDHIRVRVRVTDIDTLRIFASKHDADYNRQWKDWYSAGGIMADVETVCYGPFKNCSIKT